MTAPWLRLDAAVFSDSRIRACRPLGVTVWIALLTLSKLHGWDGECPAGRVTGSALADYIGLPEDQAESVERTLVRLKAEGLLARDGASLIIPEWRRFQPDPTAAARQAKWRADAPKHRNRKNQPEAPEAPEVPEAQGVAGVTVTSVSHDDVQTGRTDGESPPTPPSEDPPDRFPGRAFLSPGVAQMVRLAGIDLQVRGGYGPEWEKAVQAASDLGRLDDAVAWLKDPGNLLREPRDLRRYLLPPEPFGRPPAPTPDRLKAEREKREEEALAERVRDLSRLKPEERAVHLARLEAGKGAKYRAEVERRLGGAA